MFQPVLFHVHREFRLHGGDPAGISPGPFHACDGDIVCAGDCLGCRQEKWCSLVPGGTKMVTLNHVRKLE